MLCSGATRQLVEGSEEAAYIKPNQLSCAVPLTAAAAPVAEGWKTPAVSRMPTSPAPSQLRMVCCGWWVC